MTHKNTIKDYIEKTTHSKKYALNEASYWPIRWGYTEEHYIETVCSNETFNKDTPKECMEILENTLNRLKKDSYKHPSEKNTMARHIEALKSMDTVLVILWKMHDGKIIGAIGVSGVTSAQDAQIARAGAEAATK